MKIINLFDIMPDAFTGIDTNKSKKKKRNSISLINNEITIINDELKKEFLQKSELDNLLLEQSEINSQLDINSSAADTIEDVAI